jgi:hypothetical protein
MAERITEKELVERFGTDAQKKYFEEHGLLNHSYKQNLLNRAFKYCNIRQLKNGDYSLTKQKQVPINPEYIKSATGLYQYTCPLILDYIMNNGKDKTILGTVSLAEKSKIISKYYRTLKSSPDKVTESFYLDEVATYDCLRHISDSLNYYIEQTLKYLKQMQLIIYTSNYLVIRNSLRQDIDTQGNVLIEYNEDKGIIATDKEMDIYRFAIEQADVVAETKTASERYYSSKAEKWNTEFHRILSQHGIKNIVEVHEIWSMHQDKCQLYRSEFEKDTNKLVLCLSKDFKKKLLDNASGRLKENFDEVKFTYDFLTRVCLGNSRLNKRIVDKIHNIKNNDKSVILKISNRGE